MAGVLLVSPAEVEMAMAGEGKTASPGKPGKRPHVNAGIGDLEDLVARVGATREEAKGRRGGAGYRRRKPRTVELMARIAELLEQKGAG